MIDTVGYGNNLHIESWGKNICKYIKSNVCLLHLLTLLRYSC